MPRPVAEATCQLPALVKIMVGQGHTSSPGSPATRRWWAKLHSRTSEVSASGTSTPFGRGCGARSALEGGKVVPLGGEPLLGGQGGGPLTEEGGALGPLVG